MKGRAAVLALLIVSFVLFGNTSFAEPSAPTDGLIKTGDKGEEIVRIQIRLRELGYLFFKPTGNYQSMTVDAVKRYQQFQTKGDGTTMIADGRVGAETLGLIFSKQAARAPIAQEIHIPFGPAAQSGATAAVGDMLPWNQVKELLRVGLSYEITDFNTNTVFMMKYTGGENHAEVECVTPNDTAAYKTAFGGEFNYSKRPVIVNIGGKPIAASLQGEPHGDDSVSANESGGHSCLFFYGSLSHVGNLPDAEHIKQIYIAAGQS